VTGRLVIGTRGSELALWQARRVQALLGGEEAGVTLEVVRTQGDARLDVSLAEGALDKGAFTKELEDALLEGRVDVAVHSLKDLPTTLPEGLAAGPIPERAAVSDVLLVREDAVERSDEGLLPLRPGALVGTGSPRRVALLRHACPDARTPPLFRGNVHTRLRKCVDGEVDAVVLARAGLSRLGVSPTPLVPFDLDPGRWLPAPAQGALGLELRAGDERVRARLEAFAEPAAAAAVGVERGLLALLEEGCHAALGAWCRSDGETLRLSAGRLGEDGDWRTAELAGGDGPALVASAARALAAAPSSPPGPGWARPAAPWWA
jgi:hydroxymethylbilane synthase